MKRFLKRIFVIFLYAVLVVTGFIGGCDNANADVWDDLVKWSKK